MTDLQILEKAICKAKGYHNGCIMFPHILEQERYYGIIFSHDFAKLFWNCEHKCKPYKSGSFFDECELCGAIRPISMSFDSWKQHLQRMVLEKEPLKYLEKFL